MNLAFVGALSACREEHMRLILFVLIFMAVAGLAAYFMLGLRTR